jgi:hypothetical protein
MAKTTITKNEYLQLVGLTTLAMKHEKIVRECERAMEELMGFPENSGETSDVIYGDRDLTWLLERANVTVEE